VKQDGVDVTEVTHEAYDLIASGYAQRINHLVSHTWVGKFERSLLDRFLALAMRDGEHIAEILDIGCGNGKDTIYLSQKEGVIATGLDYSSGMLSEARENSASVCFVQMDMRNLGFSGSCFGGVWANGCIYHVRKAESTRVLLEVNRVLKPSGIFSFNFKIGAGEELEENPISYSGMPRFYAYYGIEEMRCLLAQAGLKLTGVEPYPKAILGERIVQVWASRR
jgi:SAM-dependent methyltransferase